MTGFFPFSNYQILTPDGESGEFKFVADRLISADVDFFHDQLMEANLGYFFSVLISYHKKSMVTSNLDLAYFPFRSMTKETDLSHEQLEQARALGRRVDNEGNKLASFLPDKLLVNEHTENILYQISFHDIKILQVKKVVKFKCYNFLQPYISKLQAEKNRSPSGILSKMIKSLGNDLPGRLHMKQSDFLNAKLCIRKQYFDKMTDNDKFFDFRFITDTSALLLFSGQTVEAKTLVSIPSRVYSISKHYLWKCYFLFCSQLALNGNYSNRLLLTDTDSLCITSSKIKSELEKVEFNASSSCRLTDASLTSKMLAESYLKSFAPNLDFSSIVPDSHVYKNIIINDKRLIAAHRFLAISRKSEKYFWKDETENRLDTLEFFGTSPKQYSLVRTQNTVLKCKGIKRSLISKCLSPKKFRKVAKFKQKSGNATYYSIRRKNYSLFLTKTTKRVLSYFTNKRYFNGSFSNKTCYFGFPLHLKPALE